MLYTIGIHNPGMTTDNIRHGPTCSYALQKRFHRLMVACISANVESLRRGSSPGDKKLLPFSLRQKIVDQNTRTVLHQSRNNDLAYGACAPCD